MVFDQVKDCFFLSSSMPINNSLSSFVLDVRKGRAIKSVKDEEKEREICTCERQTASECERREKRESEGKMWCDQSVSLAIKE